ncbi:MAG: methionyl-tRNA formyltransferase [Rhodoglobus sp.]
MRLLFAGSPEVAIPSLDALVGSEHDVVAVLTRSDSAQGRRRVMTPTPVAVAAERATIELIKANRLDDAVTEKIVGLDVDLGVIVAYGGLVPTNLLTVPRLGWINLHFSRLPQWRGAAPVQRSIMAGDTVAGATVFRLVAALDAGDVFATITEPIGANQSAGALLRQLSISGAELLTSVVDSLADGTARALPQVGDATWAPKLSLEDGRIDWSDSAVNVHNHIRGVTPEPGASTMVDGKRLKVLETRIARQFPDIAGGTPDSSSQARDLASQTPDLAIGHIGFLDKKVFIGTATGAIELLRVHPEGRNAMDAAAWWRGLNSESEVVAS